ncbi:MAG: hypothetical protein ABW200_18165 [Hyphomicrobiaceae bacterium]
MSTGTQALSGAIISGALKSGGFLQRLLQRISEGQARKAHVMVREYLATQSDEHLASLGYSAAEIKSIRSQATGNGPSWL